MLLAAGLDLPKVHPLGKTPKDRERWALTRMQAALAVEAEPALACDVPRLLELASHRARAMLDLAERVDRNSTTAARARAGRALNVARADARLAQFIREHFRLWRELRAPALKQWLMVNASSTRGAEEYARTDIARLRRVLAAMKKDDGL